MKKHNTIDRKVMNEETFECMQRLADLVGAHWPYKNYHQYLAHEALIEQKKEEYRKKLIDYREKVNNDW